MAFVFDLGDPAVNADPFPAFARLRAEDPVHWSPAMKAWIVTRYADVKQVALNNRQISADRLTPFFKNNAEYQRGTIESLVRYLNHWMVFRDPPDHTRLRRLFTKAFTPTSVENLRPNIEDIVGHLIDGIFDLRQAAARGAAMIVQHHGEVPGQLRHMGIPEAAVAAQARHHKQRRPAAMPLVVELRAIAQFQVRHRALLARCIARLPCRTGWLSSRA